MRLSEKQIYKLVSMIFKDLKDKSIVEFKEKEQDVFNKAISIVYADFEREKKLDEEVNDMMDDLDRKNPGSFQRYKMFPLLKKKLADQKGIVL